MNFDRIYFANIRDTSITLQFNNWCRDVRHRGDYKVETWVDHENDKRLALRELRRKERHSDSKTYLNEIGINISRFLFIFFC